MSKPKLKPKPCPFCRGLHSRVFEDPAEEYYVRICESCLAQGPIRCSPSAATRAWNKRAEEK